MINTSLRALRKDPDSAQDLSMVENLKETPLEFYDQQGIDRIISVLHRLSAVGDQK